MLSLALGLTGPPTVALGYFFAQKKNTNALVRYIGNYALGFAAALFCVYVVPLRHCPQNPFIAQVVQRRNAANQRYQTEAWDTDDDDYGMEHLWLNADLQPKTSWVNIGYWKTARTATKACADLFQQLLDVSGIAAQRNFSIVELGSACAETAHYLIENYAGTCSNWKGLTLSSLQAHVATERLADAAKAHQTLDGRPKFQSFHADASKPDGWSAEIRESVATMDKPWLVALDVLYHFPTRQMTIAYMKREHGASFAATDVIRNESLTWFQRLKLRFSFKVLDTPFENVLTEREYVQMLVDCGYNEEKIKIVPITEHVFEPYGRFVAEQGQRWQDLGGSKWDYNDFWLVGSVLKFWAQTKLVDYCIIVAHA